MYIEIAWGFSTVFGILLFIAEIAIICWVVFIPVSRKAAIAGELRRNNFQSINKYEVPALKSSCIQADELCVSGNRIGEKIDGMKKKEQIGSETKS